jgi:hypothetical protein
VLQERIHEQQRDRSILLCGGLIGSRFGLLPLHVLPFWLAKVVRPGALHLFMNGLAGWGHFSIPGYMYKCLGQSRRCQLTPARHCSSAPAYALLQQLDPGVVEDLGNCKLSTVSSGVRSWSQGPPCRNRNETEPDQSNLVSSLIGTFEWRVAD